MQSNATTVDAYIDEAPAERTAALLRLRDLCRSSLSGFAEGMDYGMPVYTRADGAGFAFASQMHYISLYFDPVILAESKSVFSGKKGVSYGKSCLRFSRPEQLDFPQIERMLKSSAQL